MIGHGAGPRFKQTGVWHRTLWMLAVAGWKSYGPTIRLPAYDPGLFPERTPTSLIAAHPEKEY
jgi:hypothetical protein